MPGHLGNFPNSYRYLRGVFFKDFGNFSNAWVLGKFPKNLDIWEISQIPMHLGNSYFWHFYNCCHSLDIGQRMLEFVAKTQFLTNILFKIKKQNVKIQRFFRKKMESFKYLRYTRHQVEKDIGFRPIYFLFQRLNSCLICFVSSILQTFYVFRLLNCIN